MTMTNTHPKFHHLLFLLLITAITTTNAALTSHNLLNNNNVKRDTFILTFDGVIAPTAQTHAKLAILAALRTWPHLKENPVARVACNDNVNDDNNNWLMNKMMALSHLHMPSSMGCERVLLARMLLEEQQLDEQRSVGKRGKYASKFHPSTSYDTDTNNNNNNNSKGRHTRSNTIGSRPLTVGEISVNWSEGACLLDTLSVRYHVNNGQNPMPIIRECLQELISSSSSSSSSTNCMLYENVTRNAQIALQELLSHCCANSSNEVFIVLPHKCYLDAAVRLLSSSSFDTNKQKSNDSNNLNVNLRVGTTDALLQRKQQTNANVVDDIIQRYPNGRIDLSLPTIQIVYPDDEQQAGEENEKSDGMDAVAERLVRGVVDCDHVFCVGDYNVLSNVKSRVIGADSWSPTFGGTKININDNKSIMLSLLMPTWADNISDQNCVDAEMDPYLRAIDSSEFQELLSVKHSTRNTV